MEGMKRPAATVLPSRSLIPAENLIAPPPNRFTHTVSHDQPYFWNVPATGEAAAGTFAAGHAVLLVRDEDGRYGRVADADGLYVTTELAGLTHER
jgi:hypothetical protein